MKRLGLIRDDDFTKEWVDFEEKIMGTPLIGYIEDRDTRPTCMIPHDPNISAQMLSVFGIIRRYISKKQKESGIIPGITTQQSPQQILTAQEKKAAKAIRKEQARKQREQEQLLFGSGRAGAVRDPYSSKGSKKGGAKGGYKGGKGGKTFGGKQTTRNKMSYLFWGTP